jgi:hypothetical protein
MDAGAFSGNNVAPRGETVPLPLTIDVVTVAPKVAVKVQLAVIVPVL